MQVSTVVSGGWGGLLAVGEVAGKPGGDGSSSLLSWMALLAAVSVVPFLLTMITSFAKLVIVGGIVRQAIGAQQVPPNSVITGLALILTVHIMWPVGWDVYGRYDASARAGKPVTEAVTDALGPLERFLTTHTNDSNRSLFESLSSQLRAAQPAAAGATPAAEVPKEAAAWVRLATVEVPAFVLTELTQAFQIGFLLFIPFVVIDLVVGNVLVSMGMTMLTPATVALPLKFLLFVLVDGWRLLVQGLVAGYAVTG